MKHPIITYSLLNGQKNSDHYYLTVSDFAYKVLSDLRQRFGEIIPGFLEFIRKTEREKLRITDEYLVEPLVLGVLWRVYAPGVVEIDNRPFSTLKYLTRVRKKNRLLKPIIDWLRGILGAIFLLPDTNHRTAALTIPNMEKLLNWLAATGDFPDEVKRLRAWHDYLAGKSSEEVVDFLNQVLAMAEWFEKRSQEVLGVYTPNVDSFLNDGHQRHLWHEDRYFTGRRRVEYHMAMVASEILNHNMRNRFLESGRHVVILPPCMCAPADKCQAQITNFGYLCAHCTPGCRVHQITLLGQKYGFEVLVMPDDLNVFGSGGDKDKQTGSLGVVGVSCPLTNPGGHWRTRDMDVPVQGVLLDYCGCKWHWGLDGHFPTDTNIQELLKILGI